MLANYSGATDEGLVELIAKWESERAEHVAMIKAIDTDIAGWKAEQERRALEAYWEAHEGERLAVGDKVCVTEAATLKYMGYSQGVGKVLTIQEFLKRQWSESGWVVSFGVRALVDLADAVEMRRAYLAREQQAAPSQAESGEGA